MSENLRDATTLKEYVIAATIRADRWRRAGGARRGRLIAARSVTWENDPWARGAYAFFASSFPPSVRRMLAVPWRRVFFGGEHTSITWQGYMNGAVESGLRAAEEVFASTRFADYFCSPSR